MADEQVTPKTEAPVTEEPQTTEQLLQRILDEQKAHRDEVAQLRQQIAEQKATNPVQRPPSSVALSAEELAQQRANEIAEHDYYCPGCGRLFDYQRECTGRPEAPHAPIEVISTDELKGEDTSKHTAAPGVNP